jgi:UDP-N-acetylmuramate-alanine ligase
VPNAPTSSRHAFPIPYLLSHEIGTSRRCAHALDLVYIDQVFPSAREKSDAEKITSQDLEVLATQKGYTNIHGCASREDLIQRAKLNMRTGDVLLTLGAGDIYKVIPILEAV